MPPAGADLQNRTPKFEVFQRATDTEEPYDGVAVGVGISNLARVTLFQKHKGGRRLVVKNHPIFLAERSPTAAIRMSSGRSRLE
jgi:hypothetical protein